jgi:tetratricopeptide (TPR) repeat protein
MENQDISSLPIVKQLIADGYENLVNDLKKIFDNSIFFSCKDISSNDFILRIAIGFCIEGSEDIGIEILFYITDMLQREKAFECCIRMLLERKKIDSILNIIVSKASFFKEQVIFFILGRIIMFLTDEKLLDYLLKFIKMFECLKNSLPICDFDKISEDNIVNKNLQKYTEFHLILTKQLEMELLICKEEKIGSLCIEIAEMYIFFSCYEKAKQILKECLKENIIKNEKIKILFLLGDVYIYIKKFSKACNFYNDILVLLDTKDYENRIKVFRNIGTCHGNINDKKKEERFYKKSLNLYEKDSIEKAKILDRMGDFFNIENSNSDDMKKISKYYSLAFEMRKRMIEKKEIDYNSVDMATSLNNIAIIFKDQNKLKDSIQKFKESIKIWESFSLDNYPNLDAVYLNLASVYQEEISLVFSTEYFKKVKKLFFKSFVIRYNFLINKNIFENSK